MSIQKIIKTGSVLGLILLLNPIASMSQTTQETPNRDSSVFFMLLGGILFWAILILVLSNIIRALTSKSDHWKKNWDKTKILSVFILLSFGFSDQASAQEVAQNVAASDGFTMNDTLFWGLILSNVMLGAIAFFLIRVIKNLIRVLNGQEEKTVIEPDFVDSFVKNLTKVVPIEQEEEVMMDHSYDGIRELDNVLPPWWVYMFYATIIFAFVYLGYYFIGEGKSSTEEYAEEMSIAKEQKENYLKKMANAVDESNVKLLTAKESIEGGQKIFQDNCVACHGPNAEGASVGPNLVDEYWVHGGGIQNVFKTIKYGFASKGMKSWESDLSPRQINEVASYILSLQGSNPANAKEPQGEKWIAPSITISDSLKTDSLSKK